MYIGAVQGVFTARLRVVGYTEIEIEPVWLQFEEPAWLMFLC
jgi:hypothetical protein